MLGTMSISLSLLSELIRSRRTSMLVDRDRAVPVELIGQLCELAMWAPNHKRTWPWRFALFTGDGRARLGEALVADMIAADFGDDAKRAKTLTKYLRTPAVLVVGAAPQVRNSLRATTGIPSPPAYRNILLQQPRVGSPVPRSTPPCSDPPTRRWRAVPSSAGARLIGTVYLGWPADRRVETPVPTGRSSCSTSRSRSRHQDPPPRPHRPAVRHSPSWVPQRSQRGARRQRLARAVVFRSLPASTTSTWLQPPGGRVALCHSSPSGTRSSACSSPASRPHHRVACRRGRSQLAQAVRLDTFDLYRPWCRSRSRISMPPSACVRHDPDATATKGIRFAASPGTDPSTQRPTPRRCAGTTSTPSCPDLPAGPPGTTRPAETLLWMFAERGIEVMIIRRRPPCIVEGHDPLRHDVVQAGRSRCRR